MCAQLKKAGLLSQEKHITAIPCMVAKIKDFITILSYKCTAPAVVVKRVFMQVRCVILTDDSYDERM